MASEDAAARNRDRARTWYWANRERVAEYHRRYRLEHQDARRQADASYYAANRERIKARSREWHARNKPIAAISKRRRYERNGASIRATNAKWRAANAERIRTIGFVSKARRRGAPGSHSHQEWVNKLSECGNRCVYCGRMGVPLARDHVVPIVLGGSNNIDNIVPACRSCNSRKGRKTLREFLEVLEVA